jgi:serine/threonine protein kinase
MYIEYCTGGDLDSWLKKQKKLNDAIMCRLISTVLKTLYKIQKKYPDFRHNDLHMNNIFVAKRGFLIGDFGWSRLKKNGTNPAVNTANGTSTASFWGVGPKTDARYDHHMFLNDLLSWITPSRFPKTLAFLNTAIPDGYRGSSDTHVLQRRLKYLDPCPGLPSLYQLIHNKYIRSPPKRRKRSRSAPVGRRLKIKGPTGRMVYADGSSITLRYLKNLARKKNVNISNLANKRQIVSKLFNV